MSKNDFESWILSSNMMVVCFHKPLSVCVCVAGMMLLGIVMNLTAFEPI